jgi:hypothetical protein
MRAIACMVETQGTKKKTGVRIQEYRRQKKRRKVQGKRSGGCDSMKLRREDAKTNKMQEPEYRSQKTEHRKQNTEYRKQNTEPKQGKREDKNKYTTNNRLRTINNGQLTYGNLSH